MSAFMKDATIGEKTTKRITKGLQKLFSAASAVSVGEFDEDRIFFVAPKAAGQNMDLTQVNFHILSTLKQSNLKSKTLGLSDDVLSLYRNYFSNKAHSTNINCVYFALRGLKLIPDQGFLQADLKNSLTFDGAKSELKFTSLSAFNAEKEVKAISNVTLVPLNKPEDAKDITTLAKSAGSIISVDLKSLITEM